MKLKHKATVKALLDLYYKGRKEQRFWDGQKAVYVVLLGSTVVLPCINRRNVWTDWSNEEEDQQVCVLHEIVFLFLIHRVYMMEMCLFVFLSPALVASRWSTGTASPQESATTARTGWWTCTPQGSSAATDRCSSRGR